MGVYITKPKRAEAFGIEQLPGRVTLKQMKTKELKTTAATVAWLIQSSSVT